ncbi:tRNA pseudouridine(55) synthase TruB [Entomomonas asaccharolytica]|uniref:tRNA pseudouridine synthase B n=1 Tax=Entomomonas asaccharolytica TaxID=2785331 RepID=A0A974RYX5_9GAMM|nr:tRNA pseudouridine(55) synthase TruB [Entomomonas asaccharolytica]QQP86419.1 tRNA pseudouridine(55) synthase TruB [Entomomonas asaccharolytica]
MSQVKRKRRSVDGVLILNKPLTFSSNAALQKVRWLFNANKAGHTGSLDPLATGVLPICFGEATKFSQYLLNADKRYEVVMQLGITTATGDAEGQILEQKPVNCTEQDLLAVLPRFRGEITQIPPMYSAIKKDGQPLYKLARAGEIIDREPRQITIDELELLSFEGDKARLVVSCSKGTYIRTLVEDIGQALGCGAHVAVLCRTEAGPFHLEQAIDLTTLIELQDKSGSEALDQFLLPVDAGLLHWPSLELTEHTSYYWLHGQPVRVPEAPLNTYIRVRDHQGRFIGIGEVANDGRLAPKRLIQNS